ncbi:hypothetical protein KP79_PYT23282 [Mizuhopecten yessoensis]|uniref:C1q domain-containing protein n=1 Tax=Mizuhopecten yessoensis TaxID=6573 RepID=A0A210Q198_MIZYE|nr:hypothetical protein KP79_PYT23282 [Mizuhopecten yessoensis]
MTRMGRHTKKEKAEERKRKRKVRRSHANVLTTADTKCEVTRPASPFSYFKNHEVEYFHNDDWLCSKKGASGRFLHLIITERSRPAYDQSRNEGRPAYAQSRNEGAQHTTSHGTKAPSIRPVTERRRPAYDQSQTLHFVEDFNSSQKLKSYRVGSSGVEDDVTQIKVTLSNGHVEDVVARWAEHDGSLRNGAPSSFCRFDDFTGSTVATAFYVSLRQDIHPPEVNRPILFNQLILNTARNYDTNDGVFTANVPGLYSFSWSLATYYGHYIFAALMHFPLSNFSSKISS